MFLEKAVQVTGHVVAFQVLKGNTLQAKWVEAFTQLGLMRRYTMSSSPTIAKPRKRDELN